MAKKVLILSSSPRRGGNSDLLCDRFMAGAQQAAFFHFMQGNRDAGGTGVAVTVHIFIKF